MARAWLPVVLVCIAMVGSVAAPVPVAAQDDWPDQCRDTTSATEPGTYSGTLSPVDIDAMLVDIPEGDYITATVTFDAPAEDNQLRIHGSGTSITGADGAELSESRGEDSILQQTATSYFRITPGEITFRMYNEQESPFCLKTNTQRGATGDWQISFSEGDASPPPVGAGDSDEVAELEQELEEREETIQEQEERIAELEAQLDAADGGQDVTINVEVQPGDDNQAYVDGGTAVVSADSQQADLSQMTVRYNGEDYRLMDGELALTLQGTGMQELQFQYGDTTETAMIDVQESDAATATSDQDDGTSPSAGENEKSPSSNEDSPADDESAGDDEASTNGEDESPSGEEESLPGFGVVITLIALLFASSIFVYRQRN